MKILLIRPPRRHPLEQSLTVPPLGLLYIAAAAEKAGHSVEIWDAFIERCSWKQFEQKLQTTQVDVIGFTAMTPVWDSICRAMNMARSSCRFLVVGGPHPTAVKQSIFEDAPHLDAGVVGEGEQSFVELLDWFEQGGLDSTRPIPKGVLIPKQAFAEPELPNIRELEYPARHLVNNRLYRYPLAGQQNIATMITSRGCPFRCSFCDKSVSGSQWRARTAKDIVDELEHIQRNFSIQFVNFYDDNFTLHRRRVLDICAEIERRNLKIQWKCEGRVDNVDTEMLWAMKRAGCVMIAFGVESGNPESLALLRKDIAIDQTREAFKEMQEVGIRSLAYMILGVPGESTEDVWNSIRFVREIGADYVQFSSLSAMPGTSLAEHFQPSTSVASPLDVDIDRKTVTSLDAAELQGLMKAAWRDFYLRPRPLYRLSRDVIRSGYAREMISGLTHAVTQKVFDDLRE